MHYLKGLLCISPALVAAKPISVESLLSEYNINYSDAWVINGTSYYFNEPYRGVESASEAVFQGRNIPATDFYGSDIDGNTWVEGAHINLSSRPGIVGTIINWLKDGYSRITGSLWKAPTSCWWYNVDGQGDPAEKRCLKRASSNRMASRTGNNIYFASEGGARPMACPFVGQICYKTNYRAAKPKKRGANRGTVWSVSRSKDVSRNHGGHCDNFGIVWSGRIYC